MGTPNASKINELKALYPPSTAIGKVLLLSGAPSSTSASVATWLTYEISNYQGTGGRKDATTPAASSYVITNDFSGDWATCIVPVIFNNASGSGNVVFQLAALFNPALTELIGLAHDGYVQDSYIYAGDARQINFTLRLR
jgi:hypothetical protein